MTVTSVTASTATYYRVRGLSTTYATARSTCSSISAVYKIGNAFVTPNYFVDRLTLKFDTSAIPDTDTVSDVKLKMVCTEDYSATNFDIDICEYNWSASDALAAGNQETVFDGILAAATYYNWRNTNGMSVNTEYTGPSMTSAYVSKTGATYYALRTSLDRDNTTPTTDNNIILADPAHATAAYRPTLIITHAATGWANIAKMNGVTATGIAKVNGIAVASVSKVNGKAV